MIEVNGKMNANFLVDINELIARFIHGTLIIITSEQSKKKADQVINALKTIDSLYFKTYAAKDEKMLPIEISGYLMDNKCYVTEETIIRKLCEVFVEPRKIDDIRTKNNEDVPGVYFCWDNAQHGSSDLKYDCLYEGQDAKTLYKALIFLYEYYQERDLDAQMQEKSPDSKQYTLSKPNK